MPINFPTYKNLSDEAVLELREHVTELDPTVDGSFAKAIVNSLATVENETILTLKDLLKQAFPQTAAGEFLDLWGGYENLPRKLACGGSGKIHIAGVVDTVIPDGTLFKSSSGVQYLSQSSSAVGRYSGIIKRLDLYYGTVTATTIDEHGLASGQKVNVTNASQEGYNGEFSISVLNEKQFIYTVEANEVTPATSESNIVFSSDYAIVNVLATTVGDNTNLSGGADILLDSQVEGIDRSGFVNKGGLDGGCDRETDELYRQRIMLSRSMTPGVFTVPQIQLAALGISTITRCFVVPAEASVSSTEYPQGTGKAGMIPAPGQVVAYPLQDNSESIIPSQNILNKVKEAIIAKGKSPADRADVDIFVLPANLAKIDFDFVDLVPNTATMQSAVAKQIKSFFEDSTNFGENIDIDMLRGTISRTQDLITGEYIRSFSLVTPITDIEVKSGSLPVLGSIVFAGKVIINEETTLPVAFDTNQRNTTLFSSDKFILTHYDNNSQIIIRDIGTDYYGQRELILPGSPGDEFIGFNVIVINETDNQVMVMSGADRGIITGNSSVNISLDPSIKQWLIR